MNAELYVLILWLLVFTALFLTLHFVITIAAPKMGNREKTLAVSIALFITTLMLNATGFLQFGYERFEHYIIQYILR